MSTGSDCQSCGVRPTNNTTFFSCPARMNDGRNYTNYGPRCQTQYLPEFTNKIQSSYDYRQFLIHNANDLIARNAADSYMENKCGPCMNPYDKTTQLDELSKQVCNARTCTFKGNDPYGLGLGRQFYSDEEQQKLDKVYDEQKKKENEIFSRGAECCGTTKSDLLYYPIGGYVKNDYERYSVPSGGSLMTGGDLLQ